MNQTILLVCTLIFSLFTNICVGQFWKRQLKYPLPDVTLTATQVCGQRICNPGDPGKLLHYTINPFSPSIKKGVTAQEIALQVLGQTIPADNIYSKDYNTCSATSVNPFTINDIENIQFEDGREIEYERKEKLNINVQAATEANMKELLNLTSDQDKLKRLETKIKAAYSRISGKELLVKGKYSEWGLSKEAREKIKKNDGYQTCRQYIEQNKQRIILAIGLVVFEIKYDQNSLDSLATAIDAELLKEGISSTISFSFKREITKRLHAASNVFQVLIVRHAGIKDNQFTYN